MRAAEASSRMRLPRFRGVPQAVAFVLVLGLVGGMAIEPTRQLLAQRDRISGMVVDLEQVQANNLELERQIARLENDDYIEQRARDQIGLVRPGEITYVVMPPSQKEADSKRDERRPVKMVPPAPPSFLEGLAHFIGF